MNKERYIEDLKGAVYFTIVQFVFILAYDWATTFHKWWYYVLLPLVIYVPFFLFITIKYYPAKKQ